MALFNAIIKKLLLFLIHSYRFFLSPLVGQCCRFYPSCSSYALKAIEKHGVMFGCYLIVKRLGKCHPFHPGGVDEVP